MTVDPGRTDAAAAIVECRRDGPVWHVGLNRPGARNVLSNELKIALVEAVDEFEADDTLRVMVLSGSDCGSFCAGGDLRR